MFDKRIFFYRDNAGKVGVYFSVDFLDNIYTQNVKVIQDIILKKSGRLVKDNALFLVIREFLVYIKSFSIRLEKIPTDGPIHLPRIPYYGIVYIWLKLKVTHCFFSSSQPVLIIILSIYVYIHHNILEYRAG